VIVGGDLRFERAALLRGEYERLTRGAAGTALIEKGYRYPAVIGPKYRGNVRLAFATGRFAPTPEIREAMISAANAWSAVPGSSLRISMKNTGPTIKVYTVPVDRWSDVSCDGVDACADAPREGRPGESVFIRAESLVPGCASWSTTNLASATRHELGHALGFAHPRELDSVLVKGTVRCESASELACQKPGYATIMGAFTRKAGCLISPARLTQDDYATCKAVYPAQ
jgi:hypothetical protein